MGPYDRRLASATSSMTWFYVDHPSGRIPAEGQRPEAAGCVAKALQTQQLVDDGGRAVAEIAAWPVLGLQQLVQRYTGRREAADMTGPWRDGSTRLQKLVASLQVGWCEGRAVLAGALGLWPALCMACGTAQSAAPAVLLLCAEPAAAITVGRPPASGPGLAPA